MRKHSFLKAMAVTLCLTFLVSGTAFAATPGQALDASEVHYGTVSAKNANVLRKMFDATYYAEQHPDVLKVYGNNPEALFYHFLHYGVFEGRGCSSDFNVSAYRSSYGDLNDAFGDDIVSYYVHYANNGKKENRELVTVEKAEAAGVVVKSATGATATVLTPSQEAATAPSGSASESSGWSLVVVSSPIFLTNTNFIGYGITLPHIYDASGFLACVKDGTTIEWSSSNESSATIDENGLVTVSAYGTTIITAELSTGEVLSFTNICMTEDETTAHTNCLHDVDIIEALGRIEVTVEKAATDTDTEAAVITAIRDRLDTLTSETPLVSTWSSYDLYNVEVAEPGTYEEAFLDMVVDSTIDLHNYVEAKVTITEAE